MDKLEHLLPLIQGHYNHWASVLLMMVGFYITIASGNLVKKLIGLSLFQVAVLLFYISAAYVHEGAAPILQEGVALYHNPLPHVLMLTAIVVGMSTVAVGLALIIRLKEEYGSVEEETIQEMDKNETKNILNKHNIWP